jgi:hypothetical protein
MITDLERLRSHLRVRADVVERLGLDPEHPQAGEMRKWLDGHRLHFVECKTLIVQKAGKIRMSRRARKRKERWAVKYRADFHTVAFDDRRGRKHSGTRLNYRRGVGSARLADLRRAADFDELLALATGEG